MEPSEDKELKIEMVNKLDEYRRNVPEDHDFSRFLFTLLNEENDKLAVYFIKTHSIKYLYNTLANRHEYTPLMLAVEKKLPDIVEEIINKIKLEACNYCIKQIKNIKNEILSNAFSGLNMNAKSKDRCIGSLCTSFSEINIENDTPTRKIEYYQNIILKLEGGGEWPSFDFLNDIQNKIGYFKALEIYKIGNSVDNRITDYTDIFKNINNQEISKLLSTCPRGKCWIEENKKITKGPSRKNPFTSRKNIPVENKDENVRLTLLRNKNKRQKSITEKRLSKASIKEDKETDDEDIDLGNGRTRKRKTARRKSAKRKSTKRKSSKRSKRRKTAKSKRRKKSNRVLPKLKKGSLKKYGYSTATSDKKRHSALKKSLKAYGYSTLIKKLNAVKVLTKNTSPKNSKVYAKDIKWVRKINKSK